MRQRLAQLRDGALDKPHLVLLPLLALAFYGPLTALPFFWDDAANFNWMYRRSLSSIWTDATGFPYYRPLVFSLWRVLQTLFGPANWPAFHWADLLAHAANAILVASLAGRILSSGGDASSPTERKLVSLVAGALMALFPFAALTVGYVAAGFHLYVTLLALGAILSVLRFHDTARPSWAALAVSLAALAPFAHESGVVIGGLMLVAVLAVARRLDPARPAVLVCFAAVAANVAFLPLWLAIPKTRPETFAWVGWESLGQSLVFFLQALTYPLQFPARWLMDVLGWTDMLAVAALGLVSLCLAAIVLLNRLPVARNRVLLFTLGYWLLALSPSAIGLPFSYIVVSPRLLIFASPAAATLWATVIVSAVSALRLSSTRRALVALAATALLLIAPAIHLIRTVRLHRYALAPIETLAQAVRADPAERQLVINAPNWVAPVRADYGLGHEGLEIMPSYVTPQLLAWTNTGLTAPVEGRAFPNIFPGLNDHYFDAWGPVDDWNSLAVLLPDYDRVWVWQYTDGESLLLEAGRVELAAPEAPAAPLASFDDRVWLVAAQLDADATMAHVELTWRSTAEAAEDVFTHVFSCAGELLGQRDGATLGGIYPLWLWPPGVIVRELRHVPLARPAPDDCYRVEIGLFSPLDGGRTAALDPQGSRLPNDAVVLTP